MEFCDRISKVVLTEDEQAVLNLPPHASLSELNSAQTELGRQIATLSATLDYYNEMHADGIPMSMFPEHETVQRMLDTCSTIDTEIATTFLECSGSMVIDGFNEGPLPPHPHS